MDYAHIYEDLILVNTFKVPSHNEEVIPVESAIFYSNNTGKKFMTFGLPKRLKKYIEKNTNNFFKAKKSRKYFTVMSPNVGSIIEEYKKETPNEWYPSGVYIMSENEKEIFKEYFDCGEL